MKKFLLLLVLAMNSLAAIAQTNDIIVFRNGNSVEAKISAVNDDNLEYYRADNPNGPKFTIAKSKVAHVVFSNGSREEYNTVDEGEKTVKTTDNRIFAEFYNKPVNRNVNIAGEVAYPYLERKKFYFGFMVTGGLSCSNITGISPDAEEYYRNSPGYTVSLGAVFDYYPKESSSWYVGGSIENVIEKPRMKASVSGYNVVARLENNAFLCSVHAGQHFVPQMKYGGGNFYWKAGMALGFSYLAEGKIEIKGKGENEQQTIAKSDRIGFQARPFLEAGMGIYMSKFGLRYSPSITPMINVGGMDKSVHNITIVCTTVF